MGEKLKLMLTIRMGRESIVLKESIRDILVTFNRRDVENLI